MPVYNTVLILCLCLFQTPLFSKAQAKTNPNIIIILADDLGWADVGFHGSDIKTPNLDLLAKEGIILNHYYSAPICSPTRAGLMTGRYPGRFGLRQTVVTPWSEFGVDTSAQFIPAVLEKAGYRNRAAIGKWHLGHAKVEYLPLQRGFTHFYGCYNGAIDYFTHKRNGELDWHSDEETSYDNGYATDLITAEAVKCIEKYKSESPFFLYVAYNAPHAPLQAKQEDLLLYGFDDKKPLFNESQSASNKSLEAVGLTPGYGAGNTKRQTYAAMVTCMDRGIGEIVKTLKRLNIDSNTLVLFQSDNGAPPGGGGSNQPLRGHKIQEWDGGVRTVAIIKWPGGFTGGKVVDQVMGYIDVLPTLCEIVGIKGAPAKELDGLSMLSVLKDPTSTISRNFYLGYGSILSNNWKLVKANGGNPQMSLQEDMLFNIMEDVSESENVKHQNAEVYSELMRLVAGYDSIQSDQQAASYNEGKDRFTPPKEWKIMKK